MWATLTSLAGQAKATLDVVATNVVAVSTKATEQITQTYEKSQQDLHREEEKAKQREAEQKLLQSQVVVPLWTVKANDVNVSEQLKKSILALCEDDKNFADDQSFAFNMDMCERWAVVALNNDPQLGRVRHRLVRPGGLSESKFWRAYFAKVFELRTNLGAEQLFDPNPPPLLSDDLQAVQLDTLASSKPVEETPTKQDEDEFKNDLTQFIQEDEFVRVRVNNGSNPEVEVTAEPELGLENLEEMLADVEENGDANLDAELELAVSSLP